MSAEQKILIGRCSFWPEARDPEAWLRGLVALAGAAEKSGTASWKTPRGLGERVLRGHLSRRGVPGLFGLDDSNSPAMLHGVGLLELNSSYTHWQLSDEANQLVTVWQGADHRQAIEALALCLLRRSVWLRLALIKLRSGAWELCHWEKLKAANGQLRVAHSLLLGEDAEPSKWMNGIGEEALGAWWPELAVEGPIAAEVYAPKTAKSEDGLSLSPLKSPLYLLDSLGWLNANGSLSLPPSAAQEPYLKELEGDGLSPTILLDQLTGVFSDHRGVFPLEPVMLRLAHESGMFPAPAANDSTFIAWTDRLLGEAIRTGVVELLSSEPGQPRHGRGLFGDAQQKLLRWRVHPGFDELHRQISSSRPREPLEATQR